MSTNYAQIFEGVCEGELRPIIKERGQVAGVRVEAHLVRLLYIDSVTFFVHTGSLSSTHDATLCSPCFFLGTFHKLMLHAPAIHPDYMPLLLIQASL